MKHYNFDEIIPRKGSHCVKHDGMTPYFGRNDLLPLWVADMDFRSPDFVLDALRNRCNHEVLGYAVPPDSYWQAVQQWLLNHYHISADLAHLHFIPGIVAGIAFVLQAFTQPTDSVLVMNPVYPPFLNLPQGSHRHLVSSPLLIKDGRFAIDFDDLDRRAKGCRLLILSNPHNPGGTVWSRDDLSRIAEICDRHHLLVVADEIHADLTLPGHTHTSYSTVSDIARNHSITFLAPSKTFNIAGLSSSTAYIPNEQLRSQFFGFLDTFEVANGNIFAFVGAEAAFRYGEEWLHQLLDYLAGNVVCLKEFLDARLPQIRYILPEASFLPWLDFSAFGLSHQQMRSTLIDKARVALNDGTSFGGEAYNNHFRINIGCPRSTLLQALNQIASALQ